MSEKFVEKFEKKVREKFPFMYNNFKFNFEDFVFYFPKASEKIINEILKENYAHGRKALK